MTCNSGYWFIAVILAILWGIPSLISGEGFFHGIKENIVALFYLAGIAITLFIVYKIFLEK